jgi:signal transduction histidine kinase
MRLADFILANIEPILADWESFARSLDPGRSMNSAALRDHAIDILRATARDMKTDQSLAQQTEKSQGHGHGGAASDRLDNASTVHGVGRVDSGFDVLEVVSEYRALRASVLRLWRASNSDPDVHDLDDITRFNESIDQSLTRAVAGYTRGIDQSRRMFLAILSHDLRNPLNAITLSAKVANSQVGPADSDAKPLLSAIMTSAEAMTHLVDDLLDFAQSGLGGAIPVRPELFELDVLCREVVNELRRAHPTRTIDCDCPDKLVGRWDAARIRQVLSNLLGNAIQHGSADAPVHLRVTASGGTVEIQVRNQGDAIPANQLRWIFNPLRRGTTAAATRGSIGLGLYIAKAIVAAHHGTIDVTSTSEDGTCFTVRLPQEVA